MNIEKLKNDIANRISAIDNSENEYSENGIESVLEIIAKVYNSNKDLCNLKNIVKSYCKYTQCEIDELDGDFESWVESYFPELYHEGILEEIWDE
jgi:hypothetical protein